MTDDRWETLTVWSTYGASIVSGWAGLAWTFEYSRHNAWSLPLTIAIILFGGIGGMLAGMLGSTWIVVQLGSLRKRKRYDDNQAGGL
jgi:hypothetical protein